MKYKKFKTIAEIEEYLSHDKIECLLCGKRYIHLGHHISQKHKMDIKEYKKQFNIPFRYGLASETYRQSRRIYAKNAPWREKFLKGASLVNAQNKGVKTGKIKPTTTFRRKAYFDNLEKARLSLKKQNQKIITVNCIGCGRELQRSQVALKILEIKNQHPSCPSCASKKYRKSKLKNKA